MQNSQNNDGVQQRFDKLLKALNVNDVRIQAVAAFWFNVGLSFALKEDGNAIQRFASLTQQAVPAIAIMDQMQEKLNNTDSFTQSEAQWLQAALSKIAQEFMGHREAINRAEKVYFNLAEEGSAEGTMAFNALNHTRNTKREFKQAYKKLSAVQRKVKKMVRK